MPLVSRSVNEAWALRSVSTFDKYPNSEHKCSAVLLSPRSPHCRFTSAPALMRTCRHFELLDTAAACKGVRPHESTQSMSWSSCNKSMSRSTLSHSAAWTRRELFRLYWIRVTSDLNLLPFLPPPPVRQLANIFQTRLRRTNNSEVAQITARNLEFFFFLEAVWIQTKTIAYIFDMKKKWKRKKFQRLG